MPDEKNEIMTKTVLGDTPIQGDVPIKRHRGRPFSLVAIPTEQVIGVLPDGTIETKTVYEFVTRAQAQAVALAARNERSIADAVI